MDYVNLSVTVVAVLLILDRVITLVRTSKPFNTSSPTAIRTNGTAGEKSTEYWESRMSDIVRMELKSVIFAIAKQEETLKEIRDGIRELVTITRERSRVSHADII